MIVRERPSGLRLLLVLRGSVLQRIQRSLLLNIALATLVTAVHGNLFSLKITLTPIPFTLIGLPLAIFLGFRNTTAYDRYWEGASSGANWCIAPVRCHASAWGGSRAADPLPRRGGTLMCGCASSIGRSPSRMYFACGCAISATRRYCSNG